MLTANAVLVLVLTLAVLGSVGFIANGGPLALIDQWHEHRYRVRQRRLELKRQEAEVALLEEKRLNEQLKGS